jgi:cytochrome P450
MIPATLVPPSTWYQKMQMDNPVHYDPDFRLYFGAKGAWQIFRYKDAQRVLSDYEIFSNEYMPKSADNLLGSNLNQTDPPRHKQLRALVTKAFAPSMVAKLESWIYSLCYELIDPWLDEGEMNFVKNFSIPLPGKVTAQLLGVPDQDHDQVNAWINAIASDPAVIGMDAFFQAQQEMGRLFMTLLEERRQIPQDDLITHLLQAEIDGERLSTEDTLAFCIALLIAGNETTNGFLANAMYTFAGMPDVQSRLENNINDIPQALNEVLRFQPPVQTMCRIVRKDVELAGQHIKKGDMVNVWLSAANRDPEIFSDPETFNMKRDSGRALSFGHGAHYCIGAMLARIEARIAFEVIFERMENIRFKAGMPPVPNVSTIVAGFQDMYITFDKK